MVCVCVCIALGVLCVCVCVVYARVCVCACMRVCVLPIRKRALVSRGSKRVVWDSVTH